MVGSGATSDRSKEAVGMMALHEALRTVCLNSDWTYSVFWTIRPRPRVRGGNGCKVGDDNGSLMLMWEDGFCRGRGSSSGCVEDIDGEDLVRKAFSKMSIQLYNYGEGLMGKVASDKCHKWVFKEPTECEPNISNYWQSSFDALPPEWTDQFESGIQTIAVIQAGHGLLQLGSCKIIPEDLHFVLRMRHTFESLGYQSGFYLSQLFSSTRNTSSSASLPSKPSSTTLPIRPPPPLFNWGQRPLTSPSSMLSSPNFQQHAARLGFPQTKDETHMFLMPHASSSHDQTPRIEDMMGGEHHENDIKWPNGLSFFNALTGRADDAKLLFNPESLGGKQSDHDHDHNHNHNQNQNHHHTLNQNPNSDGSNPNEFLSLDSHHDGGRKMDKFKRSFTLPTRVASSSSSTSMDHHQQQQGVEYRNSEGGMYSDVMETFLE
ncbi:protein RICE SALT SENSITIVE 3 isoform X2 [Lathyrus oleraceus]|uniref:Variant 2, Protein RICE SALT SENSITIVE 3 n=1 Tax=Pisum sativum TaxID=3888 RepID=A0A9D4X1U6_PEA|nr:protein RICE SALT SENSITIVE 3 isoform X2 [Pisum sativum]KAI5411827.1 variant 2, Protein RICE SALT SENSITIVE 3 [Pisum sativum]